ncbi:unnamed protein product [Closterium sp. Naga37s-1]|nr:unnamed protein product [Closterium sp. Naga37s-1]
MNVLNRMEVTNQQTLLDLVNSRPAGTPLITVSNHMATYDWLPICAPAAPHLPLSRFPARAPPLPLSQFPALSHPLPTPSLRPLPQPLALSLAGVDRRPVAVGRAEDDPLLWGGQGGLRIRDPKLCRWTLTASEICFTGLLDSYIFCIGKSIPITRNEGVFQPGMDEALLRLQQGDWLNIFPEARIIQQHGPLPRLKWGLASLLDRLCPSLPPPILLCVGHSGLERIIPQNYRNNKRPLIPLWNQRVSVVVGEPFSFDLPSLRQQAKEALPTFGADALLHSPEVLTQRLQELMQRGERSERAQGIDHRLETGAGEGEGEAEIVNEERMEEGRKEVEREAEAAALRRRIGNVMAVGSEETRRMYAHMMEDVRQRLEAVVMEAHDRQRCMK